MAGWVLQKDDPEMPMWLNRDLSHTCEYCCEEMENYYNDDGRCTNRRCSNSACPETVAQKIAQMCDILLVSGIKEGRSRELVRSKGLRCHFDAVPYILKGTPKINLFTLFKLAFIEGIGEKWSGVTSYYGSVDEVKESYRGPLYNLVCENYELLKHGEKYFDIIKPNKPELGCVLTGNVMLTGDILGLKQREDFIAAINQAMNGLVSFKVVGKRKTDVLCCIKDVNTPVYGKAQVALENNIPIKTPAEFRDWVAAEVKKRLAEGV